MGVLPEVVDVSDGVTVVHGGLDVEMPLELVPLAQKRAIELARRVAKPVIVVIQMAGSVIKNPCLVRAEVSDCMSAILDDADAVTLSSETSVDVSPVEAACTVACITESTEENGDEMIAGLPDYYDNDHAAVICEAAALIVEHPDSRYPVTPTRSGTSAHKTSRLHCPVPMPTLTFLESTRHRLAPIWDIQTYRVPEVRYAGDMM